MKRVKHVTVQEQSGTQPETCSTCKGAGQINQAVDTPFGRMMNRRTCSTCHGTGKIIKEKCSTCRGEGKVQNARKLK